MMEGPTTCTDTQCPATICKEGLLAYRIRKSIRSRVRRIKKVRMVGRTKRRARRKPSRTMNNNNK
jgi:adenine deaminase